MSHKKKVFITRKQKTATLPPQQNTQIINAIDLFCGCGGLTTGLKQSGINIIAGIDFWDKAIDNYKKNHQDHLAICADLTKLSPHQFQSTYNTNNTQIDLIVGGPSCQGYSNAGKRDPNDLRNSLFMEYAKYLDYYKPKMFLMENVMGLLSMKTTNGELTIKIITNILGANYNLSICKLYASDFEVPQNRRRVIIIGVRKDLNIIPPEPQPIITDIAKRIPVKTVLLDETLVDAQYFLSEKAIDGIQKKKNRMISEGKGFGAQYLQFDMPSYTIPARYYKDGYDALVKYSDTKIRRLTELELKRIQTFPDTYILEGNKKEIIMQIGNAVAVKFAYHLGQYIQKIFSQIQTPQTPQTHI